MSDDLGDLTNRVANLIRRGVIHSVTLSQHPTCRVRLGDIITAELPICQWYASKYRQDIDPFAVGDAVTVLSEAGDLRNGRVYPGWNIDAIPAPGTDENTHKTVYNDGTTVSYNRETHHLEIVIAQNGTYKIVGDGTLDGHVHITRTLIVDEETLLRKDTWITANLAVDYEVSDRLGTMNEMRVTYNGHNHIGDSGGMTRAANQKMT